MFCIIVCETNKKIFFSSYTYCRVPNVVWTTYPGIALKKKMYIIRKINMGIRYEPVYRPALSSNIIMQQITIFPLKPAMHLVYAASYELLPFL